EAARLGDGARPPARRAALGGGVPSRPVPRRVPRPADGSSPEEGRRRGGDGSRPDREARGGHRPHGGAQEEPRGAEGRRRGTGGGHRARRETAAGRRPCVHAGLVAPARDAHGRLRFDFVDLILLRTTRGLLEKRVPVGQIRRVLESLRRQIGGRPLTRLSIFTDGKRVVAWDGDTRWQPESGQFLFNFDSGRVVARATKVARLPKPASPSLPPLSAG